MPRRSAIFWSGFDPYRGMVPSAEDDPLSPLFGQERMRFDDLAVVDDFWRLYRRVLESLGFRKTVAVIFRVEADGNFAPIGNEISKGPSSVSSGTVVPDGCIHVKDLWKVRNESIGSAVYWAGRLAETIEWFSWHLDRWHKSRNSEGDERLGPAIVAAMEVGRIVERLETMIVWVGDTKKTLRDLASREVAAKKQLAAVRPKGSKTIEKYAAELAKIRAEHPNTNRSGLISTLAMRFGKSDGYLRNVLKHELDALGLPPGPRRGQTSKK